MGSPKKLKRNKKIFDDYVRGMTQKEIAEKHNISQQMISKIITKCSKGVYEYE